MKTKERMRTLAISVAGMLLFSGVFLATDAFAQVRGGRVTVPHNATGLRGGGGVPFASHSGGQGLKAVGSLLGSVGGGYYGHESHHAPYSYAKAYRDVGLADAAVGLVGTLLGGYSYQPYPAVVAAPVAVVPYASPYPVAVVSSPRVIVDPYPYGYAPYPYPYSGYYGYGASYYYPSAAWNVPYSYPYGYYGYEKSYHNLPTVYGGPRAGGYYPEHHGSYYRDGNYRQSGTWQNGHGGTQVPMHQGSGAQGPVSAYHGGAAPSFSGALGGGRSPQQSAVHSSGRSYRIR